MCSSQSYRSKVSAQLWHVWSLVTAGYAQYLSSANVVMSLYPLLIPERGPETDPLHGSDRVQQLLHMHIKKYMFFKVS